MQGARCGMQDLKMVFSFWFLVEENQFTVYSEFPLTLTLSLRGERGIIDSHFHGNDRRERGNKRI